MEKLDSICVFVSGYTGNINCQPRRFFEGKTSLFFKRRRSQAIRQVPCYPVFKKQGLNTHASSGFYSGDF
jgi:hypothetical protein